MSLREELKKKATDVQTARDVGHQRLVSQYLIELCKQNAENGEFNSIVSAGIELSPADVLSGQDIQQFCKDNELDCNLLQDGKYKISFD